MSVTVLGSILASAIAVIDFRPGSHLRCASPPQPAWPLDCSLGFLSELQCVYHSVGNKRRGCFNSKVSGPVKHFGGKRRRL